MPGHQGAIVDLHFSENGVFLASCSEDNTFDKKKGMGFERTQEHNHS